MSLWIDVFIVALLPLTALFTVLQKQPYFALISRGIMGVVAVLLYAVMGAPDVALTEALVGTLLTVILYAITVRSTQVLRLGVLAGQVDLPDENPIRRFCSQYKLALRKTSFSTEKALSKALKEGQVDAVHIKPGMSASFIALLPEGLPPDQDVTVVAKHGRWHERKMKDLFRTEEQVLRLDGGHR
jgi:putative multicomponent Na+:H+ antiporter subunit B